MVDWGFAVQVAAGGFGMVFFLLVLLSIIVWATSKVILRLTKDKAKPQS
jgi:Na+-transporting methylmalonyl-CoA/oxaloacetate decarboxylase gamma subunit